MKLRSETIHPSFNRDTDLVLRKRPAASPEEEAYEHDTR